MTGKRRLNFTTSIIMYIHFTIGCCLLFCCAVLHYVHCVIPCCLPSVARSFITSTVLIPLSAVYLLAGKASVAGKHENQISIYFLKKLSQRRAEPLVRGAKFLLETLIFYNHCYSLNFFWIDEKFSNNNSATSAALRLCE